MAYININFNGTEYFIEESKMSELINQVKTYLSTNISGTGARVKLDGQYYNIDSAKLASATNKFSNYIQSVSGSGKKVTLNGISYTVSSSVIDKASTDVRETLEDLSTGAGSLVAVLGQAILGQSILGEGAQDNPEEEVGLFSWDCRNSVEGRVALIDTYSDNAEIGYKISDWAGSPEELLGLGYSLTVDGQTNSWLFEYGSNILQFDYLEHTYYITIGDGHAVLCVSMIDNCTEEGYYFPEAGIYITNFYYTEAPNINAQFTVGIHVNEPKEITDSWEEITEAINSGMYSQKYSVGDYKNMTLTTGEVVPMQIVAFDTDIKVDGTKSAISWLSVDTLNQEQLMTSYGGTNANGWIACDLRSWLYDSVYTTIPQEIKSAIVTVKKSYYDYTTQSTLVCEDNIWIPSVREISGITQNEYYDSYLLEMEGWSPKHEDQGAFYPYCSDASVRYKLHNGEVDDWWLRTACADWDEAFRYIDTAGWHIYGGSVYTEPVAIGFCM